MTGEQVSRARLRKTEEEERRKVCLGVCELAVHKELEVKYVCCKTAAQ
jgi:hypothetical protein